MRKLAIVVALSSTAIASPAIARDGAWYIGADFGAMIVEDIEFEFGRAGPIPTGEGELEIDLDPGFDGAAFVGYDLGSFRLEAEVAYKRARLDAYETVIGLPGDALPGASIPSRVAEAGGGSASVLSFMANAMFDFGDDDGISGFVGGGVGYARVSYNNMRAYANQGPFLDDSDSGLAWQAIAGVRQAITDNIDVTVRYRFFNTDDVRTVNWLGDESKTRFRSHSLLGGLTFNFGGAEEPLPPPVAVGPFVVFFDWDRDDITPQAAAILDNAAQQYAQTGQARVVLSGHADRSGSDEYNVGLSQRRANNVRQYLAGRGIPDGVITTEAFGESRPLVETADGVREPQNRRVEIVFGTGSGW